MALKLLVTGRPGVGKTTIIKRLAERLPQAAGFYTEEIREGGVRKGFDLVRIGSSTPALVSNIAGGRAPLSHVDFKSHRRVGKYGVDIGGFERFLDGIPFNEASLIIIDEIGKMECLSGKFVGLISQLLYGGRSAIIATIAKRGTPFIEGLKKMSGVEIIEATEANRQGLPEEILALLAGASNR